MIYHGHVENGRIVLDGAASLPEGAEVRIDVVEPQRAAEQKDEDIAPTLYERLAPAIGAAQGLPEDAARNVDHYLYGAPKQ